AAPAAEARLRVAARGAGRGSAAVRPAAHERGRDRYGRAACSERGLAVRAHGEGHRVGRARARCHGARPRRDQGRTRGDRSGRRPGRCAGGGRGREGQAEGGASKEGLILAVDSASMFGLSGKLGDLKRRLLFLIGAMIVYRIGAHIPVPGIDPVQLAELFNSQRGGILDMFHLFSGGALGRFTIFALGIMPSSSASIIMQLMTVAVPSLEQLKKEGEAGRRKITQYTRYGTLGLALFQSLGIAIALESQQGLVIEPGFVFRLSAVVTLVTGTMFLMW